MTVEGIAQHIHEVFQKTWARCIQKAGQKRFRCFGQSFSDELAVNYCDEVSIGGYQFTPQNLQKPRGFFFRFAAWRFNIRALKPDGQF